MAYQTGSHHWLPTCQFSSARQSPMMPRYHSPPPSVRTLCAPIKQKQHSETSLCYRMASADTRKMTVTLRGEQFPLKDTGILILHQDMRIPKEETFCVLATAEQKGICAVLSLGDWSGHHVAGTVWGLTPAPGFIIHSPIPQSPLGMIIRQRKATSSCEKNVSVVHQNPGPGWVRSREARIHRDPQHSLPCVHTHTHPPTHTLTYIHSLSLH